MNSILGSVLQVLRDSIWQFVGAVLALLALYVTFRGEQIRRRKKELTYQVESVYALLTDRLEGDLQILYRGRALPQAFLALVRIENTGNRPIMSQDYHQSLRLLADERVSILSATVIDSYPPELKIPHEGDGGQETLLGSVLLNPGDRFTVQTLVEVEGSFWTDYQFAPEDYLTSIIAHSLRVEGRIVGVSGIIRHRRHRSVLVRTLKLALNPVLALFIGLLFLVFGTDLPPAWKIGGIVLFAFIILGGWLLFLMRWLGIDRE